MRLYAPKVLGGGGIGLRVVVEGSPAEIFAALGKDWQDWVRHRKRRGLNVPSRERSVYPPGLCYARFTVSMRARFTAVRAKRIL